LSAAGLGGGCARALHRADPRFEVTLVEANPTFTACPFSNAVIAGLRDIAAQRFGYDTIRGEGIAVAPDQGIAVDPQARRVTLRGGSALDYDRLVLAPGIAIRWDALPGVMTRRPAVDATPGGLATDLAAAHQLEAMPDGGTVVISAPANPFRCPPALRAGEPDRHYLKKAKPRSKLIYSTQRTAFRSSACSRRLAAALPRADRMGIAVERRKVTSVDRRPALSSPILRRTRRMSATSSHRSGPGGLPRSRGRRHDRLVPDRSDHLRIA
jgi:hypothetical protein